MTMQLDVITPVKKIFSDEVDEVIVNTTSGQIAILPHHINLFTKVMPGEMIIKQKKDEQYLAITGGFLEVANNKITVLADYAVKSEDIEVEKAIQAQKRAEELLKKKEEGISQRDQALAEADIRRSILELQIANRRRRGSQR
jgi:F-type H+-transporting ATPase subunit epsilon